MEGSPAKRQQGDDRQKQQNLILKSKGDGEKTIKVFGVHSVGFVSYSKHSTTILSQ